MSTSLAGNSLRVFCLIPLTNCFGAASLTTSALKFFCTAMITTYLRIPHESESTGLQLCVKAVPIWRETKISKVFDRIITVFDEPDQSNKSAPAVPPWASRDSPQPVLGRFGPQRTLGVHSDRR